MLSIENHPAIYPLTIFSWSENVTEEAGQKVIERRLFINANTGDSYILFRAHHFFGSPLSSACSPLCSISSIVTVVWICADSEDGCDTKSLWFIGLKNYWPREPLSNASFLYCQWPEKGYVFRNKIILLTSNKLVR